jgi:S-formylglutathione hydrolase FrmB
MTKAGAQRAAEQHNVAIVCPDTSPRGANIPDEAKDYDFGLAAGFYVNATQVPWAENYRMYDYVVEELDSVVRDTLPVNESKSSKKKNNCFLQNLNLNLKSYGAFDGRSWCIDDLLEKYGQV